MSTADYRQQHEERIARRASAPDAVNLFHNPKPIGGRKPGPHRIGCIDQDGNYWPSITAAAMAHGCSVPNVLYHIRRGTWRYANETK